MYIYSIVSSSKLRKVLNQKQGAFTRRMKLFCYGNGVVSFVMYIYICVYVYTCMYVCICVYIYVYICIYIRTNMNVVCMSIVYVLCHV